MYLLLKGHGVVKAKKIKDQNRFICTTTQNITVICNSDQLDQLPHTLVVESLKGICDSTTKPDTRYWTTRCKEYEAALTSNDVISWARTVAELRSQATHKDSLSFGERKMLDRAISQLQELYIAIGDKSTSDNSA